MTTTFIERRDERKQRFQSKRAALDAAVSAIRRNVPDLPGLIQNLIFAGGHSRLVAALQMPAMDKAVADIGGKPHPDATTWNSAVEQVIGAADNGNDLTGGGGR